MNKVKRMEELSNTLEYFKNQIDENSHYLFGLKGDLKELITKIRVVEDRIATHIRNAETEFKVTICEIYENIENKDQKIRELIDYLSDSVGETIDIDELLATSEWTDKNDLVRALEVLRDHSMLTFYYAEDAAPEKVRIQREL